MTTTQKIEKLNEACKGSLSISYSIDNKEWEMYSWIDGTPLTIFGIYPKLSAPTFDAVVDKAYKFVFSQK